MNARSIEVKLLPLSRAAIETRKDQIAAQNFTVRQRARAERPNRSCRLSP
jgi:hypothetical protein